MLARRRRRAGRDRLHRGGAGARASASCSRGSIRRAHRDAAFHRRAWPARTRCAAACRTGCRRRRAGAPRVTSARTLRRGSRHARPRRGRRAASSSCRRRRRLPARRPVAAGENLLDDRALAALNWMRIARRSVAGHAAHQRRVCRWPARMAAMVSRSSASISWRRERAAWRRRAAAARR